MYEELYNLFSNLIFNGSPSTWAYGELFCQGLSAVLVGALVCLPFLILWRIIKRFL